VREADLIAAELNRNIRFNSELVGIIPDFPDKNGSQDSKREFFIKVDNREDGVAYIWNADKFSNRVILMRDKYNEYVDNLGKIPDFSNKEDDPFWDKAQPIMIGKSYLELATLAYSFDHGKDAKIFTTLSAYPDGTCGELTCSYVPCDDTGDGEPADELMEIAGPEDLNLLLGKQIFFKVKVDGAKNLPIDSCTDCYVEYIFKHEPENVYRTPIFEGKNPDPSFNYEKLHSVDCVNDYILDYFNSGNVSKSYC
jgi:hypothetical protein